MERIQLNIIISVFHYCFTPKNENNQEIIKDNELNIFIYIILIISFLNFENNFLRIFMEINYFYQQNKYTGYLFNFRIE